MNLQLNDPTLPPAGEMISQDQHAHYNTTSPMPMASSPIAGDIRHFRNPSLGEIHQELEQEQEAQVVSFLFFILGAGK